MLISSLVLLLTSFICFANCELTADHKNKFERDIKNNPSMIKHYCEEGFPYASVGEFNVTSVEHFKALQQTNEHLLLIISAEFCAECCRWESWFDTIMKSTFQNSTSLMSKYNFKVARLDIFDQDWYKKENFVMDELPYMVYYKKGELFTFPSIRDPPRMARMVDRYNNFYQELTTVEEAKHFMLKDYHYDNTGRLLTRPKSIAIIHDKEEYGDQLNNYKRIAQDFQWREDISFGILEDKKVAMELKSMYPEWFRTQTGSNFDTGNTVLVHRKKARFLEEFTDVYDLDERAGDYDSLHDFVGMGSLGLVEELTHLNRNAFHMQKPKVILFYNPIEVAKTEKAMDNFQNTLAKKIGRKYNWLIADGRDNKRKMLTVGVNGCVLPCIGFEAPTPDNQTFAYNNDLLGSS